MITDKEWFVVSNILVPNPSFNGSYKYDTFEWTDERPYPSQAEIDAAIADYDAEATKKTCKASAKALYEASIAQGYEHTDGHTYYCNERGVIDLCLTLVLHNEAPDEPVYMLDINGDVVQKTLAEFKALAVLIGRHHYQLRQAYWAELQACEV